MSEAGEVIYNVTVDTSELEQIASEQLTVLNELYDYNAEVTATLHTALLCVIVLLGALLGALIFRHTRR